MCYKTTVLSVHSSLNVVRPYFGVRRPFFPHTHYPPVARRPISPSTASSCCTTTLGPRFIVRSWSVEFIYSLVLCRMKMTSLRNPLLFESSLNLSFNGNACQAHQLIPAFLDAYKESNFSTTRGYSIPLFVPTSMKIEIIAQSWLYWGTSSEKIATQSFEYHI